MHNFLLHSDLAKALYDNVKGLPIIDYHNHLIPKETFSDITTEWITADPYKHRLMRMSGVEETYITGNADSTAKFRKWCEIFPYLTGTPVYDFSLMELHTVFKTEMLPCPENAEKLYEHMNGVLQTMTPLSLLDEFGVEYASPCHTITENVDFYRDIPSCFPSLRCDTILDLSFMAEQEISTEKQAIDYIYERVAYFKGLGCRFVDVSLDDGFTYDATSLKGILLRTIGELCGKEALTLLLHMGAMRNTSDRLRKMVGKAGNYAGIGTVNARGVCDLLNDIEKKAGVLPKTVLFTLNPMYNEALCVLSGSFSRNDMSGVVTMGPAWWFCDHKKGITEVLETVCAYGILNEFIGMTTDSRSYFSFVRHDYFRRILCNFMAEKTAKHELSADIDILIRIARNVCYDHAKKRIER